jgi:hypothetical protein
MTDIAIGPGCVLHWDGFKLSDGSEGHKYFVIVGAKPSCNYLSSPHLRKNGTVNTYREAITKVDGTILAAAHRDRLIFLWGRKSRTK